MSWRGGLISSPEDGRVGNGPEPSTCGHLNATSLECHELGRMGIFGKHTQGGRGQRYGEAC